MNLDSNRDLMPGVLQNWFDEFLGAASALNANAISTVHSPVLSQTKLRIKCEICGETGAYDTHI